MSQKKYKTTIAITEEVNMLLQTLRSCYTLVHKTAITNDSLIKEYLLAGVQVKEPKLHKIMQLTMEIGNDEGRDVENEKVEDSQQG